MAAKRMDLNVPTFLVLSGCSNPLGQTLAQELCGRLAAGSVALLLDESPEQLQTLAQLLNEQQQVQPDAVQIFTGQRLMDAEQLMEQILQKNDSKGCFQRSIIVHNEGDAATHVLIEPQSPKEWNTYVERQLMAPVALNQRWLRAKQLAGVEKLVINVTSSLQVRPLIFNTLLCSCKRARDMYFRAMAAEEQRSNVHVLSYAAGLFKTHDTQLDINGNIVDPDQLLGGMDHQKEQKALPRVQPLQSTLKLINILEQKAFVSGHDVDYYDTFVL